MEKKIVDAIVDKNYGINGSLIKKTKIVAKKRKLNSKNPKYNKDIKVEKVVKKRKLMCTTHHGCKIYGVWYEKPE